MVSWPTGTIFWRGFACTLKRATREPSQSLASFRVLRRAFPAALLQGYSRSVLMPLGPLVPRPTSTIFGWGSARTTPRAPRGPSQSLAIFRVPRRPHPAAPHQGNSTPVTAPRGCLVLRPLGPIFGRGPARESPARPEAPRKALPHFESRRGHTPPPRTKAIAQLSRRFRGVWLPDLWTLFLSGVLPATPPERPETPRKVLLHSECCRGHTPPPPTKVMAYSSQRLGGV